MNYKVGDKVRLIKKDYFVEECKQKIDELPKRVATIEYAAEESETFQGYHLEEIFGLWSDEEIECLASDYKESVPVSSRWELLDIR